MRITGSLLENTLDLVSLARETSRLQGSVAQAEKLSPVEKELRTLVEQQQEPVKTQPTGVMAGDDFKTLLATANSAPKASVLQQSTMERTRIVTSMSAGGMSDMNIARYMGVSKEEVRLLLGVPGQPGLGVKG